MTARTATCTLLVASAAAGLLLAIGHAPAQAPPPNANAEQRLKALEEKMGQVLKHLEGRAPVVAIAPEALQSTVDLITTARDFLQNKVEQQQQALQELRLRSPFILLNG